MRERETAVEPCLCSSKAESFKIHGRRHMLVIVLTYGEATLNESMADHKSSKTFCFERSSRMTEATMLKGNCISQTISVNDNAMSVTRTIGI